MRFEITTTTYSSRVALGESYWSLLGPQLWKVDLNYFQFAHRLHLSVRHQIRPSHHYHHRLALPSSFWHLRVFSDAFAFADGLHLSCVVQPKDRLVSNR